MLATRMIRLVLTMFALAALVCAQAGCSEGSTSPGGAASIFRVADGLIISDFTGNHVNLYGSPFSDSSASIFSMSLSDRIALALDGTNGLITEQFSTPSSMLFEYPYPLIQNPTPIASLTLTPGGPITEYGTNLYFSPGTTIQRTPLPLTNSSSWSSFSSGFASVQGLSYVSAGLLVADSGNATLPPGVTLLDATGAPIAKITNGITSNLSGVCGDGMNSFFAVDLTGKALLYAAPFSASSTPAATITSGLMSPIYCRMNFADQIAIFVNNANVTLYKQPYTNASTPYATITSGLTGPSAAVYATNITYKF